MLCVAISAVNTVAIARCDKMSALAQLCICERVIVLAIMLRFPGAFKTSLRSASYVS